VSASFLVCGQGVPTDSVRHAVRVVFARPEYQWGERSHPLRWLEDWWRKLMSAIGSLDAGHPILARVIFWAAVVALVGILVHFGYVAWRIYRATVRPQSESTAPTGMRLEDARAYRERADALAQAARYTEALAYRFIALLLELERARAVQFDPSKTPAEYIGEARLDAEARASFVGLVERLYRHVFGAEPCDARAYEEFGAAAQWVTQHVAPA
jgi:hypothetical protein